MKDGLYRVLFQTDIAAGSGVVVIDNGRIRGGDSVLFYVGSAAAVDGRIRGEIRTNRHTPDLLSVSVFGMDRVHLFIDGPDGGDEISITGQAEEAPERTFHAVLTWLSD
jgi:hypothetical protein